MPREKCGTRRGWDPACIPRGGAPVPGPWTDWVLAGAFMQCVQTVSLLIAVPFVHAALST